MAEEHTGEKAFKTNEDEEEKRFHWQPVEKCQPFAGEAAQMLGLQVGNARCRADRGSNGA